MRTLMIAPSWLGDAIVSHTLIQKIQLQHNSTVDVVCRSYLKPIYAMMSGVKNIYPTNDSTGHLNLKEKRQLANTLKGKYDQAFILPHNIKSALIPWLAKIPNRIGWRGECRFGLINHAQKKRHIGNQTIVEYANLLRINGKVDEFENCLKPHLVLPKYKMPSELINTSYIIFAPGASFGASKCWPVESFKTLGMLLIRKGFKIVLLGSKNDQTIAKKINLPTKDCINLTGVIDLVTATGILNQSKLLVSNDAGLMHVAAALDKPIVAMFGPTALDKAPPLSTNATILSLNLSCQPCQQKTCPLTYRRCLDELHPNTVFDHVMRRLECVS